MFQLYLKYFFYSENYIQKHFLVNNLKLKQAAHFSQEQNENEFFLFLWIMDANYFCLNRSSLPWVPFHKNLKPFMTFQMLFWHLYANLSNIFHWRSDFVWEDSSSALSYFLVFYWLRTQELRVDCWNFRCIVWHLAKIKQSWYT